MAELTKFQKYKITRVHRSQIKEAPYNPRSMPEENRKSLKKIIKKYGLIEALVWNIRTTNLVGGHRRLEEIDTLEKNLDYYLDVCEIDVSEEEEVKLNLILNNTSLMGEYDREKLQEIKQEFPEINFIQDIGFTKQDIEFLELDVIDEETKPKKVEQFEKYKDSYDKFKKDTIAEEKKQGNSVSHPERNDKLVTIVCESNIQKWEWMQQMNQKETIKFIKYDDFIEFIKEDYRV